MKKTVFFILLFILLSGCGEVRQAKAYKIRQEENRKNDLHYAVMAEKKALKPTIIAIKETLLWSGMYAGIFLTIIATGASSCYIIIFVIAMAQRLYLYLIPLDRNTKQYPLIVTGGKQAYNPNTLASSSLTIDNLPYPQLVDSSTAILLGRGPKYNSYGDYEKEVMLIK